MQRPPRATPRESTEAMVRNIGRELAEIEQAIGRCRGDRVAEPRLTGTWMAHLLISSKEATPQPADRHSQAAAEPPRPPAESSATGSCYRLATSQAEQ